MPGQARNKTGVEFEKYICELKCWKHKSKNPRLKWTGEGSTQFLKSKSLGFDYNRFKPIVESSKLIKYDAIDQNGNFIEIKDYPVKDANNWLLYSEFFAVKRKEELPNVAEVFGDGDIEKSRGVYNSFISKLIKYFDNNLIGKLVYSNIGIQFKDGFISNNKLEFRSHIVKNAYVGYDRIKIEFRLR